MSVLNSKLYWLINFLTTAMFSCISEKYYLNKRYKFLRLPLIVKRKIVQGLGSLQYFKSSKQISWKRSVILKFETGINTDAYILSILKSAV
jgi:hypothetical protein